MQDEQIVALYWQRDEGAIAATEKKYGAYLIKIAHNILASREDSEESVNDTYLAAWESIPPQKPTVLSTYLAKLTRRIAIDIYRRRSAQKRQGGEFAVSMCELEDVLGGGTTPELEFETKLLGEALNRFLHALSADERNTFIGRYFYMDPLREVAAYCGMSEGKAKSMLYRTRLKLRDYLRQEGLMQ
ncbi:MAG: sigma-70 family RNA polymerase sigma factor [Clostridia bacterium]|nr:sigma-70 family RNA polymerase sigma factor [Clostridia bacterium]